MDILAGVDDIPWATLDDTYGPSDYIPGLLREVAAGSEEALETLGDFMINGGTLYEATGPLVPFLARIAASGVRTFGIVELLGTVASCDDDGQKPEVRGKTRAALAEEVTGLIPLLADPSDEMRDTAAWALPQSLAADCLVPPLLERWVQENSPLIAASVLRGLSYLDPAGTAALAAGALAGGDSRIRLIAAWACVEGGMPWSGDLREAALAWTADGALMKRFHWSFWTGHPFGNLVDALVARGDPAVAAGLVVDALTRTLAPEVGERIMLAVDRLAEKSRSAAAALIGPLIAAVAGDDPQLSESAIIQLSKLGALAHAADELAAAAETEGPSRRADWALSGLVEIGDPRCVRLLVRDRVQRPFALGALLGTGRPAAQPPFSVALLEEIRACLRGELLGERATRSLIGLIGSWGPAAEAAMPDLLELPPRHAKWVGFALADITGATPEAISLLRQAAGTSLDAAARLCTLTGDEQLLIAAIESDLTQSAGAGAGREHSRLRYDQRQAAEAARTVTRSRRLIAPLAATLKATASQTGPDHGTRRELALALWHHSGDPGPALEIIAAEFSDEVNRSYLRFLAQSAQAAGVIGPAARPLVPLILPLLDCADAAPEAAWALLRIDAETHGGIPLAALAEQLLSPFGHSWSHTQMAAVQVLGEIGLPQLPAHVVARLREIATQDRRIVESGHVQAYIRDDDKLRAAILDLIGENG